MPVNLKSVPLLKYYGEHAEVSDFYLGFRKRLIANDFSGKLECFYYEVLFYEKLRNLDLIKNDLKFHLLHKSSREKLTQLIISAVDALGILKGVENELRKLNTKKVHFPEEHYRIMNLVESYVFKLISFLDVMAKTNSYLYKLNGIPKVPQMYGQQKYIDGKTGTFKKTFDTAYQNRLLKNNTINVFHKYRNKFSHEKSIIMIPYFRGNNCKLVFSVGDNEGIKIGEAIYSSIQELKRFILFAENYLIKRFR